MEVEVSGLGFEEGVVDPELALAAGASSPPVAIATTTVQPLDVEHISSPAAVAESHSPGNKWRKALTSVRVVIFQAKISVLLPFGPVAIMLHHLTGKHASSQYCYVDVLLSCLPSQEGWVSLLSLIGLTPLSERLGYANEQLACYVGPTVKGLLDVTFGNATEIIVSIYALKNGMIRVVQESLIGSILSNMLLVLGCAFFAGGIVHSDRDQVFNKVSAGINSVLLLMALLGIMFPAMLHFTRSEVSYGRSEVALSRFSSCIMIVAYASYLYFQLKTHRSVYSPIEQQEEEAVEEDEKEITEAEAICWLFVLSIWISVLAGYLVDAMQGPSDSPGLPEAFVSFILLPIAEHARTIMFAMKNKLDITLGIAIGSSTRISIFVIPLCVIISWIMGQQMDLNFGLFETATLFVTVILVAFTLQQGSSNYFKGLVLILCYLIAAARTFAYVDPDA
ncbi:hypothetical protein EJB05_30876, partial [Eragrostis curvula]